MRKFFVTLFAIFVCSLAVKISSAAAMSDTDEFYFKQAIGAPVNWVRTEKVGDDIEIYVNAAGIFQNSGYLDYWALKKEVSRGKTTISCENFFKTKNGWFSQDYNLDGSKKGQQWSFGEKVDSLFWENRFNYITNHAKSVTYSAKTQPATTNNSKLNFYTPQEIGEVGMFATIMASDVQTHNIFIKGASANSGSVSADSRRGKNLYNSGVARFGSGDDALYLHYNSNYANRYARLGSKDFNGAVYPVSGGDFSTTIFKAGTNSGYTFYFLRNNQNVPVTYYTYTIIGRAPDGTWQKYIDSENTCKQYIGGGQRDLFSINKISATGDTIVMYYSKFNFDTAPRNIDGEIIFKWDNSAKWFSVSVRRY